MFEIKIKNSTRIIYLIFRRKLVSFSFFRIQIIIIYSAKKKVRIILRKICLEMRLTNKIILMLDRLLKYSVDSNEWCF